MPKGYGKAVAAAGWRRALRLAPMEADREEGRQAAVLWAIENPPTEFQQRALVLLLRGHQRLTLTTSAWPTLVGVLGPHRIENSKAVDFDATPWLQGFREALLSEFGE